MTKTFSANTVIEPAMLQLDGPVVGYDLPNPLYVSPDGSDETGDGTEERPFRQIQHAIDLIPKITVWDIIVDEGEYENILLFNRHINLKQRGNIIIKDRMYILGSSYLQLMPQSDNLDITLKITKYDAGILSCSQRSILYTPKMQMSFTFINNSGFIPDNLIFSSSWSMINIYSKINYEGNTKINKVLYCVHSLLSWLGWYGDYGTIKNINVDAEYFAACDGGIMRLDKGEINNKYKIGINCLPGTVYVSNDFTNNAQTPMVVGRGGRIFLPNSTQPTRGQSQPQIINLEDIEGTDLYNKIMQDYMNSTYDF